MRHLGLLLIVLISFAFKTGDSEMILPDACGIEDTQLRIEAAEAAQAKELAQIAQKEAKRRAEIERRAREKEEAKIAAEQAKAAAKAAAKVATEAAKARTATRQKAFANSGAAAESGSLVQIARSLLGIEYTSGGKTVDSGFDCSGYVGYVFNKLGMRVGGDSRSQAMEGQSVPLESAQPGDIVVFARSNGKGRVFHAGIITEAEDGKLVMAHANRRSGVHELDILSSDYWREKVASVRRVL